MSSWRVEIESNFVPMLDAAARLEQFPQTLEAAAHEVKEEVKNNIRSENIIDTGNLLRSIDAHMETETVAIVEDGTDYGVYVEFGHRNVAARPFFTPAVEKFSKIISTKFIELMR